MKFKIGVCQMMTTEDKLSNICTAQRFIEEAVKRGAQIVVLPEMFNCPYDSDLFQGYAERQHDSITLKMLKEEAIKHKVHIIGGSIPEIDAGKIYNTSFIINSSGEIIAKHRKMHLFDVQVEDGISFMESKTLSSGDNVTVIDTKFARIGVCICFDIRFPELCRLMIEQGAQIIIVPASFNMTTGPMHWETLFRARAIDNQVYMIGSAPATNREASYTSYGNSIVVDPWGKILARLDSNEGLIIQELNLEVVREVREQLPLIKARRLDIYN
ncbi:carbon-nitrogen hydrolase family protein [Clostridiaceae bacterium M8S5]|nr:carbon-nitrogen hydrolase family protein [Clostridiaceae bacterium M8S5]